MGMNEWKYLDDSNVASLHPSLRHLTDQIDTILARKICHIFKKISRCLLIISANELL